MEYRWESQKYRRQTEHLLRVTSGSVLLQATHSLRISVTVSPLTASASIGRGDYTPCGFDLVPFIAVSDSRSATDSVRVAEIFEL